MRRPELTELAQARLDLNLTWDELAAEMKMSRRNVIRLLTDRKAGLHERTLRQIQFYLGSIQERLKLARAQKVSA